MAPAVPEHENFLLPALAKFDHAEPYSKSTNDCHEPIAEIWAARWFWPPPEP